MKRTRVAVSLPSGMVTGWSSEDVVLAHVYSTQRMKRIFLSILHGRPSQSANPQRTAILYALPTIVAYPLIVWTYIVRTWYAFVANTVLVMVHARNLR